MNRDKQTEEMANVLKEHTKKNNIMASVVILDDYAEALYNAGYRKASEVEREVFEEIEKTAKDAIRILDRYSVIPMLREAKKSCYKDLLGYIAELKKKYAESEDRK